MTARCALIKAFLEGEIINVRNCFKKYSLTNCAREVPRMIEEPFGVEITRTHQTGKNRYGQPVSWVDYNLHKFDRNKPGIIKMKQFVQENSK